MTSEGVDCERSPRSPTAVGSSDEKGTSDDGDVAVQQPTFECTPIEVMDFLSTTRGLLEILKGDLDRFTTQQNALTTRKEGNQRGGVIARVELTSTSPDAPPSGMGSNPLIAASNNADETATLPRSDDGWSSNNSLLTHKASSPAEKSSPQIPIGRQRKRSTDNNSSTGMGIGSKQASPIISLAEASFIQASLPPRSSSPDNATLTAELILESALRVMRTFTQDMEHALNTMKFMNKIENHVMRHLQLEKGAASTNGRYSFSLSSRGNGSFCSMVDGAPSATQAAVARNSVTITQDPSTSSQARDESNSKSSVLKPGDSLIVLPPSLAGSDQRENSDSAAKNASSSLLLRSGGPPFDERNSSYKGAGPSPLYCIKRAVGSKETVMNNQPTVADVSRLRRHRAASQEGDSASSPSTRRSDTVGQDESWIGVHDLPAEASTRDKDLSMEGSPQPLEISCGNGASSTAFTFASVCFAPKPPAARPSEPSARTTMTMGSANGDQIQELFPIYSSGSGPTNASVTLPPGEFQAQEPQLVVRASAAPLAPIPEAPGLHDGANKSGSHSGSPLRGGPVYAPLTRRFLAGGSTNSSQGAPVGQQQGRLEFTFLEGSGSKEGSSREGLLMPRSMNHSGLFPILDVGRQGMPSMSVGMSAAAAAAFVSESFQPAQLLESFVMTDRANRTVDEVGSKMLNDYLLLQNLGKGASGKVKLAFQSSKNRLVAVKVIRRGLRGGIFGHDSRQEAVRREVEVMKNLRHKNIVTLYEVIDDPDQEKLYLIMQYVDEGALAQPTASPDSPVGLQQQGIGYEPVFPRSVFLNIAKQICSGLVYLHDEGFCHRDIKPENILKNSSEQVFLADFGVSAVLDDKSASEGGEVTRKSFCGTPLFIPPELYKQDEEGEAGSPVVNLKAADVWSLGVTFFVLLTGEVPFCSKEDISGVTQEIIDAKIALSSIDGDPLKELVRTMLSVDPDARPSCRAVRATLKGMH